MKCYERVYLCIGANWVNGYSAGMCGEAHTLGEWLDVLFPTKNAREYFTGDTEKSIIDYIYTNTGKRLERIKRK